MRTRLLATVHVAVFMMTAHIGVASAQQEKDWFVEVGAQAGYHSNFFLRGPGAPAPTSTLIRIYSEGEAEFDSSAGEYTLFYDVDGRRAQNIADGDQYSFQGGLEFRRGDNRFTAGAFFNPNRVFDDEGDGVFVDNSGIEFEYRRALGRGLWASGNYAFELLRFDSVLSVRDSHTHELDATLRVPLGSRAGVRGIVYYSVRGAEDPRYNFNSLGVGGALEVQPTDQVELFVRYRVRNRDYRDADPLDSNFGREDTIHDVSGSLRWQIARHWGINAEHYFRKGISTRTSRNYDGNQSLMGVFVIF